MKFLSNLFTDFNQLRYILKNSEDTDVTFSCSSSETADHLFGASLYTFGITWYLYQKPYWWSFNFFKKHVLFVILEDYSNTLCKNEWEKEWNQTMKRLSVKSFTWLELEEVWLHLNLNLNPVWNQLIKSKFLQIPYQMFLNSCSWVSALNVVANKTRD